MSEQDNAAPRKYMVASLVECLSANEINHPSMMASEHENCADLENAALAYIAEHLNGGEAHTDDEAHEAARRYAAAEWSAWESAK